MDTEQLRYLEAIGRLGTVSAAAREVGLSQPALSRSIARLERELGTPLFERRGRHVQPNRAGADVLEHARIILRELRLMRDDLDVLAARESTLAIATVAPAPLWRLVARVIELDPTRLVSTQTLQQEAIEQGVLDGLLDLGITLRSCPYPAVRSCRLMDEHLAVALPVGHALAGRTSVSFADLDGETFLLQHAIGFWGGLVRQAMPHAEFVVQEDRDIYLQLIKSSGTPIFVTDATDLSLIGQGRTVMPISDVEASPTFYLIARADAQGMVRDLQIEA